MTKDLFINRNHWK